MNKLTANATVILGLLYDVTEAVGNLDLEASIWESPRELRQNVSDELKVSAERLRLAMVQLEYLSESWEDIEGKRRIDE